MKNYIYIFIVLIVISFSCNNHQKKEKLDDKITTISSIITNYDTLVKRVINKGDIDSYDELYYSFMDSNQTERTDSVMKYSKIMAEKYNHEIAYLHYFDAICEKNGIDTHNDKIIINLSKLDEVNRKEIKYYLNKVLEKKIITKSHYELINE